MDFFDKISDVAVSIGNDVAKKGRQVSEYARLQYQIKTREGYLNELYQELGKKYYMDHKDDDDADIREVDSVVEELNNLREELSDKQGTVKCPQCGSVVPKDADYCIHCGKQLKGVEVEVDFEEE